MSTPLSVKEEMKLIYKYQEFTNIAEPFQEKEGIWEGGAQVQKMSTVNKCMTLESPFVIYILCT